MIGSTSKYVEPQPGNYTDQKNYWFDWYKWDYNTRVERGSPPIIPQLLNISAWQGVQMNYLFNQKGSLTFDQQTERVKILNAAMSAVTANKSVDLPLPVLPVDTTDFPFTGSKSGIKLEMFKGYPADYPVMQLTDAQELKWYSWKNTYPWLSWDGIVWNPNGVNKYPAGYFFTPLYNLELGRFLVGFNAAIVGKSGFTTRGAADRSTKISYDDVNAGRGKMFFRNEVVYIKDGVCYDPAFYSDFVTTSPTSAKPNYYNGSGEVKTITGFNNLTNLTGGYWAWKWMDGYDMMWRGVQYYIDSFLKVPYNVKELVAFGSSYEYQFKKAWQNNDAAKKGYLSVVNFLEQPEGHMGFWDKFVNYIPIIWATAASVITAGLGSPLLIAAVGALGAQLVKAGQTKAAADAQKLYDQQQQKETGTNQTAIDQAKGIIEDHNNNTWLWIAAAVGGVLLLYKPKKRKK